jgi:hypothetical protein
MTALTGQFEADGGNRARPRVRILLGRTWIPAGDVPHLAIGGTMELESAVGDPVEVHVDGRLTARGELVIVNGKIGVRVVDVLATGAEIAMEHGRTNRGRGVQVSGTSPSVAKAELKA